MVSGTGTEKFRSLHRSSRQEAHRFLGGFVRKAFMLHHLLIVIASENIGCSLFELLMMVD